LLVTTQTAGSLAKALQVFADADINLSYLQSRIIPNSPFHIDFFMEFEAGMNDAPARRALETIKDLGYETRILGSYTAANIPINV
jgi:prephenate dehydratase